MGQLGNNQPDRYSTASGDIRGMENVLRVATQELENLHQGLITQMTQDVARLQAEKSRLQQDVDQLQSQYQRLQSQQYSALTQQQLAQQQVWAKQLAQALAVHLQKSLNQRLEQLALTSAPLTTADATANLPVQQNESAYRLLSSLDSTLNTAFQSLQQELNSYQSLLSQQLSQMYSLEQQGEAILESLVRRLRDQLQAEAVRIQREEPVTQPVPRSNGNGATAHGGSGTVIDRPPHPIVPPTPEPEPTPAVKAIPKPQQLSRIQLGILLVLLSSLTLSFQNVVVRVILRESTIFGFFQTGGFISPSVTHSLLLLLMRMVLVSPMMFILAPRLYPPIWRDLKNLLSARSKRPLLIFVIGSGVCLFLSQALIYIALGNISTGVATTIFFIYPAVTVLLAWWLFKDRPTFFLILSVGTIYLGCFLAVPVGRANPLGNPALGTIAAVLSGAAFAAYVILTQLCAQKLKLHPIPFSFINFWTILTLSLASLMFAPPIEWDKISVGGLWGGALVLSCTTLVGYLLNNYGIPMIGGALASVIGASGPAFTVLLAFVMIGEKLQGKDQIIGVVLVTLWVAAIGIEKMKRQPAK